MKQLLWEYAHYNLWANKKIAWLVSNNHEELIDKPLVSSFASIRSTIYHIWDAELIWLKRLQGESITFWPSKAAENMGMQFFDTWHKTSISLIDFVENADEQYLDFEIQYSNMKGMVYSQSGYQILMHIFNHGTYHRGQVVTMFRNAGVTNDFPKMDLIDFYRENQR